MRKKWIAASLTLLAMTIMNVTSAHALDVDTPYVEQGMLEVEMQNRFDFDHRTAEDRFRQHKLGIGYGFTSWWAAELEGEWEKEASHGYSYNATEIENVFQFTEQGEYFLDAGAKLAYEWSHEQNHADKVEAALILAKPVGRFTHVANIGLEQEVGDHKNRNPEGDIKWMTQYNYMPLLNPGFEYYGELGEVSDMPDWNDQKHRLGPVFYGKLGHGIKYELGWLFGLSKATEDHALKFNIEYEFPL